MSRDGRFSPRHLMPSNSGYWVKPNGDSVVVFVSGDFSLDDYDYVFKTYFAEEYAIYRKQQEGTTLKLGV